MVSNGPSRITDAQGKGCGPLFWVVFFVFVIVAVIAIAQTGFLHQIGRLK